MWRAQRSLERDSRWSREVRSRGHLRVPSRTALRPGGCGGLLDPSSRTVPDTGGWRWGGGGGVQCVFRPFPFLGWVLE